MAKNFTCHGIDCMSKHRWQIRDALFLHMCVGCVLFFNFFGHAIFGGTLSSLWSFSVPQLDSIPFADEQGIVLDYKRLKIADVDQPYNPSIVKVLNGYLIAFRNDNGKGLKRQSTVASALLNTNFQQVGKTVFFHTSHTISEDPRIIDVRGQLFFLYSHVHQWDPYTTYMAMMRFDQKTFSVSNEIDLQYHPQTIEKNWVPFVYTDLSGTSVYFVYSFNPYKLLKLSQNRPGIVEEPFPQSEKYNLTWEAKWGKISGGTPALRVGDEYLSFFHSSFWSKRIKWYVVGACTFNKTPPFQIKRISKYPILFKKMYHTPTHPHVWFLPKQKFRVMFPGGFVESKENGKNLIYLAYGENDSGLCVLTLDKDLLMESLQEFDLAKE
jgi:predicted GH43/DUF377 family glycosyl hydrolase